MIKSKTNRFQDFFEHTQYTALKNHLYNYRLRKMAVEKNLQGEDLQLVLEVGTGISPVMTQTDRIVYSDLSFEALKILRSAQGKGWYVVADGLQLPFKSGVFSHAICSEVLEHVEDDLKVLQEIAQVIKPSGSLVVTFPHRKFYFSNDDRFVSHFRRYELPEMESRLRNTGFRPIFIQKVLGPLEKVTMSFVIFCITIMRRFRLESAEGARKSRPKRVLASLFCWANGLYMGLVWLDAKIIPRVFSTVLLIMSTRRETAQ